jgi:hypothetical protein
LLAPTASRDLEWGGTSIAAARFVSLAPQPYLSACLEVLQHATIHARLLGYAGHEAGLTAAQSDCLADLMDAVENIPDLLQRWEDCDEPMLRSFLEAFDEKWARDTTIRLLPAYLRWLEPA